MLAEAAGVKRIILACGRTDLRKGIDGLAQLIGTKYDLNPFEKDVLFLFCGCRTDRIKACFGRGPGFYFCISVWKMAHSSGRARPRKRRN